MSRFRKLLGANHLGLWLGVAILALYLSPGATFAQDDEDDEDREAWLGVALQELTPSLRDALNLDRDVEGLVISGVMSGSPADKAGLEEEDVLLSLNGRDIESVNEATELVRGLKPGSRLSVSVLRDGRRRTFSATLAEREERADSEWLQDLERQPGPGAPTPPPYLPGDGDDDVVIAGPGNMRGEPRGYLGVSTIEVGSQLAEYFGLKGEGGVLVTEVSEDSPAEKAGFHAGDVILSVNDSKVDSPGDLMRLVRAHDPEDKVNVVVQRKGQVMTLHATLGESKDFGMFAPRARMHSFFDGGHSFLEPQIRKEIEAIGPQIRNQIRQHMHHMKMLEHRRGSGAEI